MLPGVDHLTDDEIKKLAMQFNRSPAQVMRVLKKPKVKNMNKIFSKKVTKK